jgi:putative restriction endonuclease
MMTGLEKYLRQFANLRRATGAKWTVATKNRAPHKPILLLALLDLVARGVITSRFIEVAGDLVELNELFNGYWRRVVPLGQTSSIAFPFFHLKNEPFWELVPLPGKDTQLEHTKSVGSVSQLRTLALGARLDEELFLLLQQPDGRAALRQVLVESCFSEEAQSALREQSLINAEAYAYNLELVRMAHHPQAREALDTEKYQPAIRYQGFRRAVVTTYDHRCALKILGSENLGVRL